MMMGAISVVLMAIGASDDAGPGSEWLEVNARAELPDGGAIGLGEPFRLVIEAKHMPGGVALLPEEIPFDGRFAERRGARRHVRSGDRESETDRYELEVLAFEAGDLTLPPIPLAFGSTRTETPRISLRIQTGFSDAELPVATSTRPEAIAELESFAASDPPAKIVFVDDYTLAWLGAGALLIALFGMIAWRLLRRRTSRAPALSRAPPPRPAHELALERLEALRRSGLLDRGDVKSFHAEISAIVREYVGARFGFDSLDLTVQELLGILFGKNAPGLDLAQLKTLLESCDLVKFAKYTPDLVEATTALNAAVGIVERTRPHEPRENAPDGGARPAGNEGRPGAPRDAEPTAPSEDRAPERAQTPSARRTGSTP